MRAIKLSGGLSGSEQVARPEAVAVQTSVCSRLEKDEAFRTPQLMLGSEAIVRRILYISIS